MKLSSLLHSRSSRAAIGMRRAGATPPSGSAYVRARKQLRPARKPCLPPRAFLPDAARGPLGGASSLPDSMSSPARTVQAEVGFRLDMHQAYETFIDHPLGAGAFGRVYHGRNRKTGHDVAIKTMPKVRGKLSRGTTLGKISREVCMMQRVQGSTASVAQLIDCFEDEEHVHLVVEMCAGGDLKQYVETNGTLDEATLAFVAAEILKIVRACHSVDILYADVKPANFCLMDSEAFRQGLYVPNNLRAIDFGCSQQLLAGKTRSSKRSGTLGFLAPEVFSKDYGHKAEVWSTGVTLYWLFAERLPFWSKEEVPRAPSLDDVVNAVTRSPIPYDYGPFLTMTAEGVDFMQRCLTRPEADRMTVDEALSHPWLVLWGQGQGVGRSHLGSEQAAAMAAMLARPASAVPAAAAV